MKKLERKRAGVVLLGLGWLVLVAPETGAMGHMGMWPAEPGTTRREEPGLFITVYDWGLGGQNCDGDCSNTALTTTGDELLGWTAACPSAWLGHRATTVVTIWGVDYWCVDAFGRPADRELTRVDGRAVYRIDIAFRPAREHPWNMEFVPAGEWSRERRWMAEFEALRAAARTSMEVDLR